MIFLNTTKGISVHNPEITPFALASSHVSCWQAPVNDLYATNVFVAGLRTPTAFLLKGYGLKKKTMEIRDCGTNGDQVIRLFQSPAELFVIQFVGNISEAVLQHAQGEIARHKTHGRGTRFVIIDGQDTARLLYAHGKLHLPHLQSALSD